MSAISLTADTRTLEQKLDAMERFTETYRRHLGAPSAIREAECLKCQLPDRLAPLQRGDRFGARIHYLPIGFAAQTIGDRFGYYLDEDTIRAWMENAGAAQRGRLQALIGFWSTEHSTHLAKKSFPAETAKALHSDAWTEDSGIAFPLYRMAGALLDYDKLLTLGVPGLRALVEGGKARALDEGADVSLFDGMLMAVDIFADSCRFYRDDASEKAAAAASEAERT